VSYSSAASFPLSLTERRVFDSYESLCTNVASPADSVTRPAPGRLDCPSVPVQRGGMAIAIRHSHSEDFVFLDEPFSVTPGALSEDLAISVQLRLRVAGPCIREACVSWTERGCRWGRAVASIGGDRTDAMVSCSIRPSCRWFAENGETACRVCPSLAY
jgi:hypothetical protein